MSSIYKKGRDGYYYYQTYVYNPKTNKKDKRIFHALGTKDLSEAKKKQGELDLKHSRSKSISNKSSNNVKRIRAILIAAISLFSLVTLVDIFKPSSNSYDLKNSADITLDNVSNNKVVDTIEASKLVHSKSGAEIAVLNINKDKQKVKSAEKTNSIKGELVLPKYNIERIDRLSGTFQQGKIYATVDENSNDEKLYMLCYELRKIYDEFSNIVVCLYADNDIGKNLAIGNDDLISVQHKKKYWLAMYTFNPVEGEYFDNNPSSYLGN